MRTKTIVPVFWASLYASTHVSHFHTGPRIEFAGFSSGVFLNVTSIPQQTVRTLEPRVHYRYAMFSAQHDPVSILNGRNQSCCNQ